eukprot:scaffold85321_cov69-Phaeocystis_antarctica.AAC.4
MEAMLWPKAKARGRGGSCRREGQAHRAQVCHRRFPQELWPTSAATWLPSKRPCRRGAVRCGRRHRAEVVVAGPRDDEARWHVSHP